MSQEVEGERSNEDSERAAAGGEQQAFAERLADDLPGGGAERFADGHLARAAGGAGVVYDGWHYSRLANE